MVRLQIARIPPDLKQRFPKRAEFCGAEAVISIGSVPRYVGSLAGSWGPFLDRSRWQVWDLEGHVCLTGAIEKVGDRIFQLARVGDEIVVLYSSRRSGVIKSEPLVEIAGHEYRLPNNLHEVTLFEFGPCTFRWKQVDGLPELHMSLAREAELLAFIGFGYDLWKGAYFEAGLG
jgi:hypothetical protein